MKRTSYFLLCIAACLAVASCSLYQPMLNDIPLMREKGDVQVNANVGFADGFGDVSAAASVAFAPGEHVAAQVFGATYGSSGYYLQGAVGTYFPLENDLVAEVYGGFGHGASTRNDVKLFGTGGTSIVLADSLSTNYNVAYLMPTFGYMGKFFDAGIGLKCGLLMNKTNYYGSTQTYEFGTETNLLVEPVVKVGLGYGVVKLNLLAGFTLIGGSSPHDAISADPDSGHHFPYDRFSIGMGLSFRF